MTPTEINRLSSLLRAKETELSGSLRKRDEIAIEKMADALDEVQSMREREVAIRNLDRDSKVLHQIRSALSRIATGTYGECGHCGDEISPKRAVAVPWAAYCIRCQEQIDRREIEIGGTAEMLVSAA